MATRQPGTNGSAKTIFGIVVIGIILVAVMRSSDHSAVNRSPANPDAWRNTTNYDGALAAAQQAVEKSLRAPATAQWPGILESPGDAKYLGDRRYLVSSWVDAENGFGALLRNNYTATVQQVGEHDWRIESITFDKQ